MNSGNSRGSTSGGCNKVIYREIMRWLPLLCSLFPYAKAFVYTSQDHNIHNLMLQYNSIFLDYNEGYI